MRNDRDHYLRFKNREEFKLVAEGVRDLLISYLDSKKSILHEPHFDIFIVTKEVFHENSMEHGYTEEILTDVFSVVKKNITGNIVDDIQIFLALPSEKEDKECDDRLVILLTVLNHPRSILLSNDKYRSLPQHEALGCRFRHYYYTDSCTVHMVEYYRPTDAGFDLESINKVQECKREYRIVDVNGRLELNVARVA
jgi:hypothetical protein